MIFQRLVEFFSRRRYNKLKGIDVTSATATKVVQLWPITSKGNVSETCYLEIPIEDVDAFVNAVQTARLQVVQESRLSA